MKIVELKMWRFRCFGSSDPTSDTIAKPNPVSVGFDEEITTLIGRNGSGKSALLEALQRLFGETRDERTVRPDDFFVQPGQTIDSSPKREMFIELVIAFPELANEASGTEHTVPAGYTTLVDLDLGRSSGDIAQIKGLAKAILDLKKPLDVGSKKNIDVAISLDREGGWGDEEENWDLKTLQTWISSQS